MRISDWSSDVCSSDLFIVSIMRLVQAFSLQEQGAGFKELARAIQIEAGEAKASDASGAGGQDALDASEDETDAAHAAEEADVDGAKAAEAEAEVIAEAEIGRASSRERVCQYG